MRSKKESRLLELEQRVEQLRSQCLLSERFAEVLDLQHSGVVLHAADTSIVYSNAAARSILGLTEDQLFGKTALDPQWNFVQSDGSPLALEDYPVNRVIRSGTAHEDYVIGIKRPGLDCLKWVLVNAKPLFENGKLQEIIVTFVDVTEVKHAAEALRHTQVSINNIIDHTPLGVCVTDENGYFESVNTSYREFYGYEESEMLGQHFTMVVPPENRQMLSDLHDRFIAEGVEIRGEWDVVGRDGKVRTILADAAHIRDSTGRPKKVTFIMNITKEKDFQRQLEEKNRQLEEMSRIDALTGVANRRHLFERLEAEAARSQRHQTPLSIAMFDIDFFKKVNDNFGHQVGDEVLQAVSTTANSLIREVDLLGRYGGEEFLLMMPDTSLEGAVCLAERIREAVEALDTKHEGLKVTISCGVAQYDDEDVLKFIEQADTKLYYAKNQGRNRVSS